MRYRLALWCLVVLSLLVYRPLHVSSGEPAEVSAPPVPEVMPNSLMASLQYMAFLPILSRNWCELGLSVQPASQPASMTNEFMFEGSCFTPNGSITRSFSDPDGQSYGLAPINADSQGAFVRILTLTGGWPAGTYTYTATDDATMRTVSVEFTITAGPSTPRTDQVSPLPSLGFSEP
jgi:hypothetical protein